MVAKTTATLMTRVRTMISPRDPVWIVAYTLSMCAPLSVAVTANLWADGAIDLEALRTAGPMGRDVPSYS